jgi:hypothetical protein
MEDTFGNVDLFCRINVQSEMPHHEFVTFIARSVGGRSHMNSVESDRLDISVDDNDAFDPEKSRLGKDRWLYFPYTLEIDPIEGVSPGEYIAAIGTLLQSLWSSCMDAVASCDFEEQLPRNARRLKWLRTAPSDREGVG